MENEIMNNVELDEVIEVFQENGSNGGIGVGVLIGAAVTGVALAAFKWGKKAWLNHKTKKADATIKFDDVENKTEEEVTVE